MKQNKFGEYLREYRKKNNFTQQELADIVEVTMNYLGRLERGERKPGIDVLLRISDKLNVSIDELLKAESEYRSRKVANEYVKKIQDLPHQQREKLYEIIDIFISLVENNSK